VGLPACRGHGLALPVVPRFFMYHSQKSRIIKKQRHYNIMPAFLILPIGFYKDSSNTATRLPGKTGMVDSFINQFCSIVPSRNEHLKNMARLTIAHPPAPALL
jgi:hypothetical protein